MRHRSGSTRNRVDEVPEDRFADEAAPRAPRRYRSALTAGRVLLGATVAAGFATLVLPPAGEATVAEPPDVAAAPAWVDAARTEERFVLRAEVYPDLPRTYAVDLQTTGGGGREDVITLGKPGGEGRYARLEIRRAETAGADASLFVALVRRAADADLAVTRAGQPFMLATRLGPFETSAVTLAAASRDLACLGFRMRSTDTRLRIAGLACGTADQPVEPRTLACLLDGLELAPESNDRVLRGFFDEAGRRRGSACGGVPAKSSTVQVSDSTTSAPAPHTVTRRARHRSATML